MSTLVGSVSVRQLTDAEVSWNDVWRCCHDQFGSALSFRHNTLTEEVQFYTEYPERVFKSRGTIPTLRLHGSRDTYCVVLIRPFVQALNEYMTGTALQTKVVPTRSKKLLLT